MAIETRKHIAWLIMHSDRGSQYASDEYQHLLGQHGMICSMSRKGNCWDSAFMERFFLNLKMERVWQREYANQMEAKKISLNISLAFIIAHDYIQHWAIYHP